MTSGAIAFPTLTPSSRTYKPGEVPMSEFTSLDGTKTYLRYGNKRTEATLSMSFSNLKDEEAAWILDHYRIVTQDWSKADEKTKWVEFSHTSAGYLAEEGVYAGVKWEADEVEPGYTPNLRSHMVSGSGSGLRWRYSSAPQVTSVYPGISNVSCNFVACLDAPI